MKREKKSIFYKVLLAILLVLLLVFCYIRFGLLRPWLTRFEAAQPKHTSQEIFQTLFSPADWGRVYDEANLDGTVYQGREGFIQSMEELTAAANAAQKQHGNYFAWTFGIYEVYFTVKDNRKLDDIKTMMTERGLRGSDTVRVRIDDRILKETAGPIESNLAQLEGSYLFFFLTIAVLGAFISFLLARDRKPEYAVMRMLGESRLQITLKALLEQFVLCLAGVSLGAAAGHFMEVVRFDGVVCTMILLCYTLGAAVAVMLTVRAGVMDILRDKE